MFRYFFGDSGDSSGRKPKEYKADGSKTDNRMLTGYNSDDIFPHDSKKGSTLRIANANQVVPGPQIVHPTPVKVTPITDNKASLNVQKLKDRINVIKKEFKDTPQSYIKYMTEYKSLYSFIDHVSKEAYSTCGTLSKDLNSVECQITLNELDALLSLPHCEQQLELFLAQRWKLIQGTQLAYPYSPFSLATKICYAVAEEIAPVLKKSKYQLLMPTVECTKSITLSDWDNYSLNEFILSDDNKDFICITECLDSAVEDGVLKHTSLNLKAQPLSKSEITRIQKCSQYAKDYCNDIAEVVSFKKNKHSFGSVLYCLIESLRAGDYKHSGSERNAGPEANVAIVNFSQWFQSLDPADQNDLLQRKSDKTNFAEIWSKLSRREDENYLRTIFCIKLISNDLEGILESNKDLYGKNAKIKDQTAGYWKDFDDVISKKSKLNLERLTDRIKHSKESIVAELFNGNFTPAWSYGDFESLLKRILDTAYSSSINKELIKERNKLILIYTLGTLGKDNFFKRDIREWFHCGFLERVKFALENDIYDVSEIMSLSKNSIFNGKLLACLGSKYIVARMNNSMHAFSRFLNSEFAGSEQFNWYKLVDEFFPSKTPSEIFNELKGEEQRKELFKKLYKKEVNHHASLFVLERINTSKDLIEFLEVIPADCRLQHLREYQLVDNSLNSRVWENKLKNLISSMDMVKNIIRILPADEQITFFWEFHGEQNAYFSDLDGRWRYNCEWKFGMIIEMINAFHPNKQMFVLNELVGMEFLIKTLNNSPDEKVNNPLSNLSTLVKAISNVNHPQFFDSFIAAMIGNRHFKDAVKLIDAYSQDKFLYQSLLKACNRYYQKRKKDRVEYYKHKSNNIFAGWFISSLNSKINASIALEGVLDKKLSMSHLEKHVKSQLKEGGLGEIAKRLI